MAKKHTFPTPQRFTPQHRLTQINNGGGGDVTVNQSGGSLLGIPYTYSSTTSASGIAAGTFRLNNAAFGSATKLFIHDTDGLNYNQDAYWDLLTGGTITLHGQSPEGYVTFRVTNMVDQGSYHEFDVVYVAGATSFLNADEIRMSVTTDTPGVLYASDNLSEVANPGTAQTNLGIPFNQVATADANFTINTSARGQVFEVTTGSSTITATLPDAATAGNGFVVVLRKVDTGTGTVITSPATRTLSQSGDQMVLQSDGSTWKVLTGNLAPTQRTGGVIAFDEGAVYNTPASPSSATVSYDLSGAIAGTEVVAYFNHGAEPTWPSGSYRVGVWNSGALNVVRFLYLNSSNVVVEVNSNNITANQGHFQTVRKTANTTRNSTSVLSADPDLVVSMLANKTYVIRGAVWLTSNATPDFKYRLQGPASPSAVYGRVTNSTNGTSAPTNGIINAYHSSDQVFLGAGNFIGLIEFELRIVNGANAGNFEVAWAQNTSDAANTSINSGSWLDYMQVN